MKRRLLMVLLVLVGIGLGFLQEFMKVNVNFHLEQGAMIPGFYDYSAAEREELLNQKRIFSPLDYYYSHSNWKALNHLSSDQLGLLKWVLTLGYTIAFLVINASVAYLFWNEKRIVRIVLVGYGIVFILSLILFGVGKATGMSELIYPVSRKLVGGLQSLVPLMLILPGWYLHQQFYRAEL